MAGKLKCMTKCFDLVKNQRNRQELRAEFKFAPYSWAKTMVYYYHEFVRRRIVALLFA